MARTGSRAFFGEGADVPGMDLDVAVVGGGVAGLRAADRLASAGASVRLYEREATVGGRVRTERRGDYRFDRGFQVLFTSYPELREAVDLDALDLRSFPPGAVVCRPNHRALVADPRREPSALVETAFTRDLTIGDKLRVLRLARDLGGRSTADIGGDRDLSIEQYLDERGFSRRFLENVAVPFFGGITLDRSLGTDSRVFEFVVGMLATGRAAVPADGMGAVPAQFADAARTAGATIEAEATVRAVQHVAEGVEIDVDGSTVEADVAIVATDPPTSADLTGVDAIPTEGKGCVTQYLGLPDGTPLDDEAHIHLNAASAVPNQVVPISTVAPEYAPDDALLLSATTLADPEAATEADATTLFERTRAVLRDWYPEGSFESLELLETVRCPFAQFAQPPGFADDLPDVRAPAGPVYLAGEYTQQSSINGALKSGRLAAEAVLDDATA